MFHAITIKVFIVGDTLFFNYLAFDALFYRQK